MRIALIKVELRGGPYPPPLRPPITVLLLGGINLLSLATSMIIGRLLAYVNTSKKTFWALTLINLLLRCSSFEVS